MPAGGRWDLTRRLKGLHSSAARVRFVDVNVALGQVFIGLSRFSSVSIFSLFLYIHSFIHHRLYIISTIESICKQHTLVAVLLHSHFDMWESNTQDTLTFNPLNAELNPICYLLALLAHYFLHVRRIRVKSPNLRLLMSYIYGAPILDVSKSHTTTHHSR